MKNKTRKYVMPLLAALPALSVVSTGVVLASCSNSESVKLGVTHIDQVYLSQSTAVKGQALTLIVYAKPGYVLDIDSFDPLDDIGLYSDPQGASEIDTTGIQAVMANGQVTIIFSSFSVTSDIYVDCPVVKGLAVSNYNQEEDEAQGIVGDTSHFKVTGADTTFIPGRPFRTEFTAIRGGGNQEYRFYDADEYLEGDYEWGIFGITADGGVYDITGRLQEDTNYWFGTTQSQTKMDFTLNINERLMKAIQDELSEKHKKTITFDSIQVRLWMCQGYFVSVAESEKNAITITNPEIWENHDAEIKISPIASTSFALLHGTSTNYELDHNAVEVYIGDPKGSGTKLSDDGYYYEVDKSRNFATLTIYDDYVTEENCEKGFQIIVDYTDYVNAKLTCDVPEATKYIQFDKRVLQQHADVPGVSYTPILSLTDVGQTKYEIAEAWATQDLGDPAEETVIYNFAEEDAWASRHYYFSLWPQESLEGTQYQGYESNHKDLTIHTEIANLLQTNEATPIDDITIQGITYKRSRSPLTRLGIATGWEIKQFNFQAMPFTETSGKINGLTVGVWGKYSRFLPEQALKLANYTVAVNGTIVEPSAEKWQYDSNTGFITFADDYIGPGDAISISLRVSQSTQYANYFRYGNFVAWQAQAAE